jgi:predicted DNA binding CopG/RHH family protein
MAKKRTGLANTLSTGLGKKVELKKKNLNLDKVEKVSEEIHTSKTVEKKEVKKVVLQKMTIEVPKDLHKKIKVKVAQEGLKIKDYIIQLVEKDLGI